MNAICPRHPLIHLSSVSSSTFSPSSAARLTTIISLRHQSSSRRTTKRLRVKPDPSFSASIPPEKINDHIVFNPPSSAPSVFHTPAAFLPRSDPRRQILAQSHNFANPYEQPTQRLPPAVRTPYEKRYHLNEEDIKEIRRLRMEDALKWTRSKLAEKFDCSQFFVALVCEAPEKVKEQRRQELENIKQKWGTKKQARRKDKGKRMAYWGRDE